MLKNWYNPLDLTQISPRGYKKMFFDLGAGNPVKVIHNKHLKWDDTWFDMHYEMEVGMVLEGAMIRKHKGYEVRLSPGEVWINGMWEPHGFELAELPTEVLVMVIDPQFLVSTKPADVDFFPVFKTAPQKRPQVAEQQKEEMLALGKRIKNKCCGPSASAWAQIHFLELMLCLCEGWKFPAVQENQLKLPQSIQPALSMIFNRKDLISTKEAAAACNMSVSGFRARFKEHMGWSFSEFALEYRINRAKAELSATDTTRKAVAQKWGFTDASHLQRYLNKTRR